MRWNDVDADQVSTATAGGSPQDLRAGQRQCVILPQPGFPGRPFGVRRQRLAVDLRRVITGFRLALGGPRHFGVGADLAIFAKALAGGFPISAVTGTAAAMEPVISGQLIHNGTFNGNPLGCAAIVATLGALAEDASATYRRLHDLGTRLATGLDAIDQALTVRSIGPIAMSVIGDPPVVRRIQDRAGSNDPRQAAFVEGLIARGIHTQGLWYLSTRHTEADVDAALAAAGNVFETLHQG